MMQPILSGKTAIITGASEGFGREVAQKFASAGASLMLCARDAEKLERTCLALRGQATADQKILFRVADVSKAGDVDALVDETIAKLGGCDILMNNAGIYGPKGDVETVDWLAWVKAIEINLYGSVLRCRALLPHFKMRRAGKIIQLSGGGATAPLPRLSAYAVSKAAIVRFVETLAEEVRGQGIEVNALAPGALNTAMLDEVIAAACGTAFCRAMFGTPAAAVCGRQSRD
jgi:NAD(P)-dependent dehydrogenase (short-subunit alcohol dehydrogenase family)